MPVLLDLDRAPALSELLKAIPGGLVQKVVPGADAFADPPIAGLGSLTSAGPSEISFAVHTKYLPQISLARACAVIVLPEIDEQIAASDPVPPYARVVCKHPYLLYARLAQWFEWARQPARESAIHPTAVIDPTAQIAPSVSVGPYAVIGARTRIDAMTQIGAGTIIGADVEIGASSNTTACTSARER